MSMSQGAWSILLCASLAMALACTPNPEAADAPDTELIQNAPMQEKTLVEVQRLTQGPLEALAADEPLTEADLQSLRDAEPKVRGLIAYEPTMLGPQIILGKVLMGLERSVEAITQFRIALAGAPITDQAEYRGLIADAQSDLGLLLLRSGDIEQAGDELRAAVAADGRNPKTLTNYASYLLETRKYEEAHIKVLEALEIAPDFAAAVRLHDFMHKTVSEHLEDHS